MREARKCLIWDFDGTLGHRHGHWSRAMVQVMQRFAGRDVDIERIKPFMRRGFPWHNPERPNPPMRAADEWWSALHPVFEEAFAACEAGPEEAKILACKVRSVYTDLSEWRLFEETVEVLGALRSEGWRQAILSNHVPELRALLGGLGLGPLVECVVNSAEIGFEKPHPEAFRAVLQAMENPDEAWMIGDNMDADVLGAEAVGLRAILVRSDDPRAGRRAETLRQVREFLQPAG